MKTLISACLTIAALTDPVVSVAVEEEIRLEYFKFVAKYGKSYASVQQMDEKYDAFKQNFEKIEAHNSFVDEDGTPAPFRMGINQFSDMTEAEFVAERLMTGAVPHRDDRKRLTATR